jgi:hypothetical protein
VVFPIDAYAKQIDLIRDESFQLIRISQGTVKPQIYEGQSLHMRSQGRIDVLETGGRKNGEAQRSGMAIPIVGMKAQGVFV